MQRSDSEIARKGVEISYRDQSLVELPPQFLSNSNHFQSLKFLRLDGNDLRFLPESLFIDFVNLEKLNLDSNKLSVLPQSIRSHRHLRSIRMKSNHFTQFPLELVALKSLRKLDLSFNKISVVGVEIFDKSLWGNDKPKQILLNGNPLPCGLHAVIATFFSMERTLEFNESDFKQLTLSSSGRTIGRVRSNSNPSGLLDNINSGTNSLSSSVSSMSSTSSSSGSSKLPDSIRVLDFLDAFAAKRCRLKELNEGFFSLKNLRYLDLSFNSFDSIPLRILETQTHLKELCFSNNRIREIPKEINKLKHLKILLLENNSICEFPDTFFDLVNMKILKISGNRFKELPQEFLKFTNLESLYATENRLEEVPKHIYTLPKIRTFTLDGNPLPASFFNDDYNPIVNRKSSKADDPNYRLQFLCVNEDDFEDQSSKLSNSSSSSSLMSSREELPYASIMNPRLTPPTSPTPSKLTKKLLSSGMMNNGRPMSIMINPTNPISIPISRGNKEPSRAASSEYLVNRPPMLKRAGSLVMGEDDSPFSIAMSSTPPSSLSRGSTMSDLNVSSKATPFTDVWDTKAIDHVRKRLSQKIVLEKEEKFSSISLEDLRRELNSHFDDEKPPVKTLEPSASFNPRLVNRVAGTSIPPSLQIRKTESENLCVVSNNVSSPDAYSPEEHHESSSKKKSIRSKISSLFQKKPKKPSSSERASLDTSAPKKNLVSSPSAPRVTSSIPKEVAAVVSPPRDRNERALRKTVSVSEDAITPTSISSPDYTESPKFKLSKFKGVSLTRKKGAETRDKLLTPEHSKSFPSISVETPVFKAESKERVEEKPVIRLDAAIDLLVDQEPDGSHVYACSLPAIIKVLLREDFGKYFEKALVYTYPCYTNTLELVQTIFSQLNEQNSKRALEVLSHLKRVYPAEFGEDRKEIMELVSSKPEIHQELSKKDEEPAPQKKEPSLIARTNKSGKITVLSFHPEELARQMALIESDLFRKIEPAEYLSSSWKKGAPVGPIGEVINHFNETSRWVSTEIVIAETIDDRIQVISHFLMVASRCIRINNFNAAMEIFSGLEALSVSRLKQTWQKLPKDSQKIMEELRNFMSVIGNWRVLRKAVATCAPPAVPYIGIAMADLVFIDEHPNQIEGADGSNLINWRKFEMVAQVVQRMHRLKHKEYNYEPASTMREYLKNVLVLGDQALFQQSVEKEGKDENAAFMIQQGQKKEKRSERTRKNTLT